MRNIYPEQRTIVCKEKMSIYLSSKVKENYLEEIVGLLQEISRRARILLIIKNVKENQLYFDILVEDTIFSIGYFGDSSKYYITKVQKNRANAYIQFLKEGILVYFKAIEILLGNDRAICSNIVEKVNVPNVKKITLSQLPETLITYFDAKDSQEEKREEDPLMGENLTRLLNLATIYNKYEKEKGQQQCNKMPLNYTKIETQAEEENTYIFYVGNANEYQEESYVRLSNKEDEDTEINGQILKIEPIDEIQTKVTIQLLKQTDYNKIPKEGRIYPIYNDVQNMVREKVIQNIKKGKIPAQSFANLSQKINKVQEEIQNTNQIVEALKDWDNHIQERNDMLTAILLETIQVVGATCIGIQSRKLFADTNFDVAIIDEAGQIQIHNILVPMSRAKKSILLRRSQTNSTNSR